MRWTSRGSSRTVYSGPVWWKSRLNFGLTNVKREQPTPATRVTSTIATITLRSGITVPLGLELAAEVRLPACPVHHLALELPAGGIDVVAARTPHRRDHAGLVQELLERTDGEFVRPFETRAGKRVEGNQVDLRRILHL